MCFSATASFSAGAALRGIGSSTLRSAMVANRWRELPFAAIPLLLAIQQLIEGVIWLTFGADVPLLNSVMTLRTPFSRMCCGASMGPWRLC